MQNKESVMFVVLMDLIAVIVIAKYLIDFGNIPWWGAVILAVPTGIVVMRFFWIMFMNFLEFLLVIFKK